MPAGVRLLYRAEAETPAGTTHFRMAAAIRPPDHLRLEFFGPVGGPRMILATDGSEARAILTRERMSDTAPASPRTMVRLTGLRLGPAGLVDLLRGSPACSRGEQGAQGSETGDDQATLTCRVDEATIALRSGGDWAASLRITLESPRRSIRLDRVEGPTEALLADELFAPAVPDGYTHGDLLREGPPLLFADTQATAPGNRQ